MSKIHSNQSINCLLTKLKTIWIEKLLSALSSGNVTKYEFLTGKDVLWEKVLPEKAAPLERFEYSRLGKELKAQTSATEKQYQYLDKVFESNKKEEQITWSCDQSNLVYSKDFTFCKYRKMI